MGACVAKAQPGKVQVLKSAPTPLPTDFPKYDAAEGPFSSTRPDQTRPIHLSETGLGAMEPVTLIEVFRKAKDRFPDAPALRIERPLPPAPTGGSKVFIPSAPRDDWTTWTYKKYWEDSRVIGRALQALGMKQYQGVILFGFNSPEWFISQMGVTMAGGLAAGCYPTDSVESVGFKALHCDASIAIVENEAKLEILKSARATATGIQTIVVWDPDFRAPDSAPSEPNSLVVMTWGELYAKGLATGAEGEAALDASIALIKPESVSQLIYTSGTTGAPKAVMLTHDNVVFEGRCSIALAPALGKTKDAPERVISYLPLSHIAAVIIDIVDPIVISAYYETYATVYFARSYDLKLGAFAERLRAVQPTSFIGVPRVWEKIEEKMREAGAKTKGLKKKIVTWAKAKGLEKALNEQLGGSGLVPANYDRADKMVLSKVRGVLGVDQLRYAISGAAPIGRETLKYFAALGINIYEVYGMTESTGAVTLNIPGCSQWGSVGYSMPAVDVRVVREEVDPATGLPVTYPHPVTGRPCKKYVDVEPAKAGFENLTEEQQGEVIFRGRVIHQGYMGNSKIPGNEEEVRLKNEEAIDAEGYMHSGDKGAKDVNGFLVITGRYKELIISAGGENISCIPIEEALIQAAPAISKAVLIGNKRKFNCVLITLKTEDASGELPGNGVLTGPALSVSPGVTTTEQAQDDPKFIEYLTEAIRSVNKNGAVVCNNAYSIQKFTILARDFSIVNGEYTPTLKYKRTEIERLHAATLDAIYDEANVGNTYVKQVQPQAAAGEASKAEPQKAAAPADGNSTAPNQ